MTYPTAAPTANTRQGAGDESSVRASRLTASGSEPLPASNVGYSALSTLVRKFSTGEPVASASRNTLADEEDLYLFDE